MRSQLSTVLYFLYARWVNFSAEELSRVMDENVLLVYGNGGIGSKKEVVDFILLNDVVKPYDGHRKCDITEFHIVQQKRGNLKFTYTVVESDSNTGFTSEKTEHTEELQFTPENLIKTIWY